MIKELNIESFKQQQQQDKIDLQQLLDKCLVGNTPYMVLIIQNDPDGGGVFSEWRG